MKLATFFSSSTNRMCMGTRVTQSVLSPLRKDSGCGVISAITESGANALFLVSRGSDGKDYHRQPGELQASLQGESCLVVKYLIPESFLPEHQLTGEEHRPRETLGDLVCHVFELINRIGA